MSIDIRAKLVARIDHLYGLQAHMVAMVREAYEAGRITGETDRRQTRQSFGIVRGRLRIANRELAEWDERHPS